MQGRSQERVHSSSHAPSISKVPHFSLEWQPIPLQDTAIWSQHCPADLHTVDVPRSSSLKEERDLTDCVSGRHPDHRKNGRRGDSTHTRTHLTFGRFGLRNQHEEVQDYSESHTRILGTHYRLQEDDDELVQGEAQADKIRGTSASTSGTDCDMKTGFLSGPSQLNVPDGFSSTAPSLLATIRPQAGAAGIGLGRRDCFIRSSSQQSHLVVQGPRPMEWAFNNSSGSGRDLWWHDRCKQDRLWDRDPCGNTRPVDYGGERGINQLPRTQGDSLCSTTQPRELVGKIRFDQDGQHLSDGVCEQDGRDIQPQAHGARRADLADLLGTQNLPPSTTCGGGGQCAGGSAITSISQSVQLYAESEPLQSDPRDLGSTHN